ncbi:DnaD domain-containing protein [Clostridium sp. ZS2-4]|uniref:DnaD domain-containing protein n=1 Tax=Clostridium sp. ZS2-4 TaxID=2987703 RepID=UPI00227D530D|nr:DnaD domain protein [Clostridium sp. ZS2-4]MCY6354205.1 DnaD domain protein [Clostridium sp. ZS2-4]
MALYRQLQVKFLQDDFVLDLTPEENFFYAYLMTNSKTTQCGIFELPKRIIEMETGYNRETEENKISEENKNLEKSIENVDFKEVVKTFNNNIHPITPIEYEKLKNWEGDVQCDAIILAIKEAVNHNARTLSYINSILNNWYNLGLYSADAVKAYQRDWNSKNKKDKNESMANAEAYMYVE